MMLPRSSPGSSTGVLDHFGKQESPAYARVMRYARQRRNSKMAAVPRWPSAAILDIIEPEIAQFDPLTRKTLA